MLTRLFAILTFPVTAFSLLKAALNYKLTITESAWLIEHENEAFELMQTTDNETELIAYQELIQRTNDLTSSIIFQVSFIALFVIAFIIFCLIKPRLVIQPLMLMCLAVCIIFTMHIYEQLTILRIHTENLRYYFLLLTT